MTLPVSLLNYIFEKRSKENQGSREDTEKLRFAFTQGALSCNPGLNKKELEKSLDTLFPLGVVSEHELPLDTTKPEANHKEAISDYDDSMLSNADTNLDWGDL